MGPRCSASAEPGLTPAQTRRRILQRGLQRRCYSRFLSLRPTASVSVSPTAVRLKFQALARFEDRLAHSLSDAMVLWHRRAAARFACVVVEVLTKTRN